MPDAGRTLSGAQQGAALGSTAAGALIAAHIAPATGPLAPIVIGVGAAVGAIVGLFRRSRTGQLKVNATEIVNAYESQMRQNLADFGAGRIGQADALQVFDALWYQMADELRGVPDIGASSLAERDRGGVYDYFHMYRDPIEEVPAANAAASDPGTPYMQETPARGEGRITITPGGVLTWSATVPARVFVQGEDGGEGLVAEEQANSVQLNWLGPGRNVLFTLRDFEGLVLASVRYNYQGPSPQISSESRPLAGSPGSRPSSAVMWLVVAGGALLFLGRLRK